MARNLPFPGIGWGLGFNWIVLPSLTLTQSVSSDYLKGRDLGSFTKVSWQANEHLKAAACFDSFSLDIPLRARATGVKGKTAILDLVYHESDLRDYGLLFTSNWLSDGNYNPGVLLGSGPERDKQPQLEIQARAAILLWQIQQRPECGSLLQPQFRIQSGIKTDITNNSL